LNEFSNFGRLPAPVMERADGVQVIAELKALYARDVEQGRLRFALPDDPVWLQADRAQLHQAIVNLIKNGLEAIGDSGHVDIALSAEGETVVFSIADSGPGMSSEQQAKLFTPNFTTKAGGSGLGLTIVERIVSDHSGSIDVDSSPGAGTTFRISIPREATS
jgi:signal transduction histidine kinase